MWTAICPLSPANDSLRTFATVRGERVRVRGIVLRLQSQEKPLIRPSATSPYEREKGHRRIVEPIGRMSIEANKRSLRSEEHAAKASWWVGLSVLRSSQSGCDVSDVLVDRLKIDIVAFHLFVKRRTVDAKSLRGLLSVPAAAFQCLDDQVSFRFGQSCLQ